jgi:hypothetical protein
VTGVGAQRAAVRRAIAESVPDDVSYTRRRPSLDQTVSKFPPLDVIRIGGRPPMSCTQMSPATVSASRWPSGDSRGKRGVVSVPVTAGPTSRPVRSTHTTVPLVATLRR